MGVSPFGRDSHGASVERATHRGEKAAPSRKADSASQAARVRVHSLDERNHEVRIAAAEAVGRLGNQARAPGPGRSIERPSVSREPNDNPASAPVHRSPSCGRSSFVRPGRSRPVVVVRGCSYPCAVRQAVPSYRAILLFAPILYLGCADRDNVNGRPVEAWAVEVRDARPSVRVEAAIALAEGAQHSDRAAEFLLTALEDPRAADVHDILARGLGPRNMTRAAMVSRVMRQATDTHPEVRRSAVTTLATLPASPVIVALLARAVADRDHEVRMAAVERLGRFGSPARAAGPALAAATRDPITSVRLVATQALGTVDVSADLAVPALVAALVDRDDEVRAAAADALGWRGRAAAEAVPALAHALGDESPVVRRASVAALGRIGTPAHTVLGRIVRGLSDADPGVRAATREALGRFKQ